jgi:hypothetical protein
MTDAAAVDALMRNMDADGDGRISWEEFLEATAEQQVIHAQNNIWWAFCEYDKDGDGKITTDELRLALRGEPPEAVQAYIDEYDTDGDGTISYEEFIRMLLPKTLNFRLATVATATNATAASASASSRDDGAGTRGTSASASAAKVTHVTVAPQQRHT